MIMKRRNEHPAAAHSAHIAMQRIMTMGVDDHNRCHYHWQDKWRWCLARLPQLRTE